MLIDFAIRLVSVTGAVWVSIAVFYRNGEDIALRLWWQCARTFGFENWKSHLPVSKEKLIEASQSPATGTALASLSIVFFLAALYTLKVEATTPALAGRSPYGMSRTQPSTGFPVPA